MKEKLKQMIIANIMEWDEKDIYAISLFVDDLHDNPCRPTVTLGYNTESQVSVETPNAWDAQEARWNYAFWIQNSFFCFGENETEKDIVCWLNERQLPNYADDNVTYESAEIVTRMFVEELIGIVKEIHQTGLLTERFGKEIPIIIHELEYYNEIAEQNILANGIDGLSDFIEFCGGE